jgi:hypothetical protein
MSRDESTRADRRLEEGCTPFTRRDFLQVAKKWSKAVVVGVLAGGAAVMPGRADAAWLNRRGGGWANRGGSAWINRRGGGWMNSWGGWYNLPSAWYNVYGGWNNLHGGWYNYSHPWYNLYGGW